MDFYQGVVVEYLRADRAIFVNTECCIQLNEGSNPDTSGPHWYCDAVALDLRRREVFLCEISYAVKLGALIERLKGWTDNWAGVCASLVRDSHVPSDWHVRPWLFVPQGTVEFLTGRLKLMTGTNGQPVFNPRVTTLESVQPWNYRSWNHQDTDTDKTEIPEALRI